MSPSAARTAVALWLLLMSSTSGARGIESSEPPLLWYDFSDSADPTRNLGTLGSGYDGHLLGNAHFGLDGGDAVLVLDGAADYVLPLGSEAAFDIGDTDFSLFARVRTTVADSSCGTSERGVIWKERTGGGAGQPGYTLGVLKSAGVVRFTLFPSNPGVPVIGSIPVNDGQFHDILAVRRGESIELYVDGVSDGVVPIGAIASTNNNNALVIGGRTLTGTGCTFDDDFLGDISEVRVYDRAVSPAATPVPALHPLGLLALGSLLVLGTGPALASRISRAG